MNGCSHARRSGYIDVMKIDRVRTVETERLRLEPISPKHADDLYRLHQDESVAKWWGEWSVQKAADTAAEMGHAWEVDGVSKWMAYNRQTDDLIGRGGLSIKDVDGARRLEVGWALLGEMCGQGYATEIGRAGLAFAFEELGATEVVAFTEPHNLRSRAVMERLGMDYLRDIVWREDHFVLYGIDRGGFERPTGQSI